MILSGRKGSVWLGEYSKNFKYNPHICKFNICVPGVSSLYSCTYSHLTFLPNINTTHMYIRYIMIRNKESIMFADLWLWMNFVPKDTEQELKTL